jgi:hypothetical protein
MRDIRPNHDNDQPITGRPLLQKPAEPKRLGGSTLPVTNVHLPTERDVEWRPSPHKKREPESTAATPKRSLFFRASADGSARIGQRERTILVVLFSLLCVVVAAAIIIFLPAAHVQLTLKAAPLLIDQPLTLRTSGGDPQAIAGAVLAREVTIEDRAPVTTTQVVGVKAKGNVTIVNRASEEQKIKEGSRLITKDERVFFMLGPAIVPPQSEASVAVEAAEAGSEGNLEPQRLDFLLLPDASRRIVYGEVRETLTGGSGELVQVVGESDMNHARQHAQNAARARTEEEIKQELQSGWLLIDESWSGDIISFETPVHVTDKASDIPYKAQVRVKVMGYEKVELEERLKRTVDSQLDQEFMLFPGPISFAKTVESIDWDKGEGVMNVRVTHTTIPRLSVPALRDKLAGRSQDEAMQYLRGLPGVQNVDIKLTPFWVTRLPRISQRISVDLLPDRGPAQP